MEQENVFNQLVLDAVRREKQVTVTVGSCYIAASLLGGGRTVHLAFKLLEEHSLQCT